MSPKHYSTYKVVKSDEELVKGIKSIQKEYINGIMFARATGRIDSTAPSATYYVHVLNSASEVANLVDGVVEHLIAPQKIIHTNGIDSYFDFDFTPDMIKSKNGVVVVLSSTEFVLTVVGTAYLSVTLLYK